MRNTENRSLSWIFLFASLQKYLTPSTPTRSLWLRFASPDFVRPRFDFRIQLQKYTSQMLSHLFRYFCAGYGKSVTLVDIFVRFAPKISHSLDSHSVALASLRFARLCATSVRFPYPVTKIYFSNAIAFVSLFLCGIRKSNP